MQVSLRPRAPRSFTFITFFSCLAVTRLSRDASSPGNRVSFDNTTGIYRLSEIYRYFMHHPTRLTIFAKSAGCELRRRRRRDLLKSSFRCAALFASTRSNRIRTDLLGLRDTCNLCRSTAHSTSIRFLSGASICAHSDSPSCQTQQRTPRLLEMRQKRATDRYGSSRTKASTLSPLPYPPPPL